MNDDLKSVLGDLLRSGSDTNAAFNTLISDYARFHFVLVLVGGLFLMTSAGLCVFFWRRFNRTGPKGIRRWPFEKKVYFAFGVLAVVLCLLLALVVVANVSNALDPRHGFAGAVGGLATPPDKVDRAFGAWLQSGSSDVPSIIQRRVDARLAWQRPKAIITSISLIVIALLGAQLWRRLIRTSRVPEARWRPREYLMFGSGVIAVLVCLLLMLMVMGNTQASLAPISLTLFYG